MDVRNNAEGVTLKVKTKEGSSTLKGKKVALTCGRWISELVPEVKGILKSVRQTVTFWKMKDMQ